MGLRDELMLLKACYKCGFVDDKHNYTDPFTIDTCPECGETAVLNFNAALDLLNEFTIKEEDLIESRTAGLFEIS